MRLSILCVKVLKIKKKFSCSKIYKKINVTTPHIERVNERSSGPGCPNRISKIETGKILYQELMYYNLIR